MEVKTKTERERKKAQIALVQRREVYLRADTAAKQVIRAPTAQGQLHGMP